MKARAVDMLVRGGEELGIALTPAQLEQFGLLAAELRKWSAKINLTALRTEEEIVVKHFLDSLTLLRVVGSEGSLLDIGSGAGFPAIPVKIARPRLEVVSVDAVEKKTIFQRHVARVLNLTGFQALHVRAEALAARYPSRFDCIVSRAFADIPTFVRLALPLLAAGGIIVAMKGKGGAEEAAQAEASLVGQGLKISQIREFSLPVSGDSRSFIIIAKT